MYLFKVKIIIYFFIIFGFLSSNSRISFSRPGKLMQTPSMAFDKASSSLFSIDVGAEIVNFSTDYRRYSSSFALKFQTITGYNISFTGASIASPAGMKEAGFHVQKKLFKYGDVLISSGIHDFLYLRDGNDVIQINDMSFFTVFTNTKKFDDYNLAINFGVGTGKLAYDPQTEDTSIGINYGGFLSMALTTPYLKTNGGLDLIVEYDGAGVNFGMKIPIISQFTINLGITHFENLSDFATESREGPDQKDLQPNAPAITMGFTFDVPNLFKDQTIEGIDSPFTVPGQQNNISALSDIEGARLETLIHSLRDSIVVAYHENKTLYVENLLLQQKMALLMDSTRVFHLERQVDKANINLIMRHISRSLRHFYAEDYRQALTEIDKVIEINPNIALAYARRGSVYYRLGDFQRATMNWNIALKLDPDFKEIQDLLRASKDNRLSLSEMKN